MNNILIVDDHLDFIDVLSSILKKYNYFTKSACSRNEIDSQLTLFNPDLILLDVMLVGEDGRDICTELKISHGSIPVLLLSCNPKLLKDYAKYYADDYIEKPFTPKDILGKINKLLKN